MTCQECHDLLSALIDRELSAEELKRVQAHLQECVQCCQECAQLCCLDAATGQACCPCPGAPADLWERVQDAAVACCAPQTQTVALQLPSPSSPYQGGVLTPEEAASYLRLSVSELMASLDALPHFKIGEHIRFRRSVLEQWMEAQEQKAAPAASNVVDFTAARVRMSRVGRM